jgi:hypothetical protein
MNLNDDVVYRCLRLGPLHQLHPGRSRGLVRYHDRLHMNCLLRGQELLPKATVEKRFASGRRDLAPELLGARPRLDQ